MSKNISRRDFARLAGIGAAASAAVPNLLAGKNIPIALQLWSIRSDCKNGFTGPLAQVAKMGFQGVEFAGYFGHSAKELRKILDDNGLKCCGSHIHLKTVLGDNLPATIEFAKTLGNPHLVIPGMGRKMTTIADWLMEAKQFSEIAEKLKPHGLTIGYHNHLMEFKPIQGQIPWEVFFDHASQDVKQQIDTGHMVHAGVDPAFYLKRYPGRTPTLHMKDYAPGKKAWLLGQGIVNFKEIIHLCETVAGTQWFIVEQETYPYPPMESSRRSLENLKKLLGRA